MSSIQIGRRQRGAPRRPEAIQADLVEEILSCADELGELELSIDGYDVRIVAAEDALTMQYQLLDTAQFSVAQLHYRLSQAAIALTSVAPGSNTIMYVSDLEHALILCVRIPNRYIDREVIQSEMESFANDIEFLDAVVTDCEHGSSGASSGHNFQTGMLVFQ